MLFVIFSMAVHISMTIHNSMANQISMAVCCNYMAMPYFHGSVYISIAGYCISMAENNSMAN